MRENARRFKKQYTCACGVRFIQTNGNKTRCPTCAVAHRKETQRVRDARRRAGRSTQLPALGPPTCPTCGPQQALKFGSDPLDGRSTTYCAVCGERPLPLIRHATTRLHDQREQLDAELLANVERAQREVDPVTSARSGKGRKIPMQTNTEAA